MSQISSRLSMNLAEKGDQAKIETAVKTPLEILDAAVGAQVFPASSLPASAYSGKLVWDSTNNRVRVQGSTSTGGTWRDVSIPVFSSLSGVTGTHTGELAFQTGDNTLNRWTGSAWTVYPGTGTATAADNLYLAEFTTTTSTPNNQDFWPLFNSEIETCPHVTKQDEGGESYFLLNTTGLYAVHFQAVWASSTGGSRSAWIINGANSFTRYAGVSVSAAQNAIPILNGSFERVFSSGLRLQLQTRQDSGGALNMTPTSTNSRTWISIRYVS